MRFIRWTAALLLTVALLYVARTSSMGRPELVTHTDNGYTFEYLTVPKIAENTTGTVSLNITGPFEPGARVVLRKTKFGQDAITPVERYGSVPMSVEDSAQGLYSVIITAGNRGAKAWYYFEVRDNVGGLRASFKTPEGEPFVLKWIGDVPQVVLVTHIFFMFATVYFVILGMLHGVNMIRGSTDAYSLGKAFFLSVVCSFVGGYPLGFMMNYYAFGGVWEGVPFGTDATDNKTQVLFVYLVLVALATMGSWTRGKFGKDLWSPKVLGWMGVGGFVLLLATYLIPHSIQFDPFLTKAVCWSWIALVALAYLWGLSSASRKSKFEGKVRKRASVG